MGGHDYLNAFIYESSTIAEKAGDNLVNAAYKAVMYNSDGNIIIADKGDTAIGVVLGDCLDSVNKGDNMNILIKDIGLIEAGGVIAKGDAVSINDKGQAVKAETGSFIFGFAFSRAKAEGELIQVQINKAGLKSDSNKTVQDTENNITEEEKNNG